MSTTADDLVIDHVTIAGSDLASLEAAFVEAGVEPEYGGEHDALPTHMSIVGFGDGTYVELIAKASSEETAPFWDWEMEANAGPCAWAIRSMDVARDADVLRERGIAVDGPRAFSRDRPDGATCEWKLAFLGEGDPGTLLPFLIEDVTPRSRRVRPTPSTADAGLAGVDAIVIAVEDADAAAEPFKRGFDLPSPDRTTVETGPFAGTVVEWDDAPVVLVAPGANDPLAERLRAIGVGPCGFVFRANDPAAARDRFGPVEFCQLGSREVAVINPDGAEGIKYLCLD